MVEILLNLILTPNWPTVSIVEFELAPFAEFNSNGIKSAIFSPRLFMKKYSLIATPDGIRVPVSINIFVFSKLLPEQSMSIDMATSRNEVASIKFISDLLGFWLAGANFNIVESTSTFEAVRFLAILYAVRMPVVFSEVTAY